MKSNKMLLIIIIIIIKLIINIIYGKINYIQI